MCIKNRILAVDDNPTNLAMIEEALQGQFILRTAMDGEEALHFAKKFLPDVILLDVMMPGLDGLSVCNQLKAHPILQHSEVILVSAKTEIQDRLKGYDVGADDYIVKPFDEKELLAKVTAALRTKSNYNKSLCDIEELLNASIELLGLVSQLRSSESQKHLDRMRIYSMLLASALHRKSLSAQIDDDDFVEGLYLASALHDVGNIALPDSILHAPDLLTDQEIEQMQKHTLLGEKILVEFAQQQTAKKRFRLAAEVARWHHECFDGSGYPDGIQGDQIPLAARIIKLADVFDAITTPRSYRDGCDPLTAREVIAFGRGIEFDPIIVEAFMDVFDEFVAVYESDDFADAIETTTSCTPYF